MLWRRDVLYKNITYFIIIFIIIIIIITVIITDIIINALRLGLLLLQVEVGLTVCRFTCFKNVIHMLNMLLSQIGKYRILALTRTY